MKELGIDKKTIKNGLLNVKWPGRFEIFIRNPLVILDGAHNEDSSLKLVENLKSISNKEDVCFLTSILEDKDIGKILKNFSSVADKIVYTSLKDYHRGLGAKEMYDRDIYFDNRKSCVQNFLCIRSHFLGSVNAYGVVCVNHLIIFATEKFIKRNF